MFFSQLLLVTLSTLSVAAPANPKVISLPISKRIQYHDASSFPIHSRAGSYMYTNVTVGTPPQSFEVTLDTGSADMWAPLTSDGKSHPGYYNPNASSTYKFLNGEFEDDYVGGEGQGNWVTDDVDVGGVALKSFQFGAAANVQGQPEGVLGVSFTEQEAGPDVYANFPYAAQDQGWIDRAAYSIYFEAANSGEGTFLLGGIDEAKYSGKIKYYPVNDPTSGPEIPFESITANGTNVNFYGPVIFDTGSIAIAISEPQFSQLHSALGFTNYSEANGQYFVDCDTKVSLQFNFEQLTIHADESSLVLPFSYFSGNQSDTYCVLATQNTEVYGGDASGLTLFGDPFLKNTYTVFDLGDQQIGLAQAVYTDKSNVQPITGLLSNQG